MQALGTRAAAAVKQADAESATAQNALSASPHKAYVPPQQLGKMRRVLEMQEEGLIKCQQKLALLLSGMSIDD